ncbi:hypothetical protein SteCoe_17797 [Stentor coeruleus]|uniref:Methyltransferase type 11 domain-containing protein n=1 Tax=Stentor coeruleus TaxID=5963 RepID=A0A1R2BY05_9CILI|nr:hypothetical protein SteCoe_17797 [Stentor coeruleus]
MSAKTISELESFWNEFQSDYESKLGNTMTLFNHSLIHMLNTNSASSILELGCGPGLGTLSLFRKLQDEGNTKASITACDLSPAMIECARKKLPNSINLRVANSENLPFEDGSFDRILAGMSLNLVPNPQTMLSEIFRVLKPGGRVALSVWGRAEESFALTVFNQASSKVGLEVPNARSNFYLGTIPVLKPMVKQTGFVDILAWHQPTVYNELTAEEYAATLYTAPNRKKIFFALDKNKQRELHDAIVELIQEKMVSSEEPLKLDGLLIVANKPRD